MSEDIRERLDILKDEFGWKSVGMIEDKETKEIMLWTHAKIMELIDLVKKIETKRQIDVSNNITEKLRS